MLFVSDLRSLFPALIAITAWRASQVSSASRQNSLQDPTCQKQLDEIYSAGITVQSPPKLTGLWTSTQCEVRAGPEFLIRKYRFFESGLFELTQFHFWDSHCHRPSFAVEARGQFKLYQASWIILGATEVDYHPRYVTLVPYTTDAASILELQLNATPCRLQSPWQPFERHVIFHYVEDDDSHQAADAGGRPDEDGVVDCLASLDLSFHELQLVRVEELHLGPDLQRTLLLGDVHPDRTQRTTYRPTGYQQALAATETVGCRMCRLIAKASDAYPPQLPIRQRPSGVNHLLPGSWVSQRCETRNYGVFLTRSVRFYDDRLLWERREFYFADGLCQKPRFTLALSGTYRLDDKTSDLVELVEEAYNIDIQIRQLKMTVNDRSLLRQLNQARSCGGQPEVTWDVGVELDVTSSNGCAPLDVAFSPAERDVILIDRGAQQQTLLYLGQPPSGSPESQGRRPTSFLPPLVRCLGRDDPKPGRANRLPYIAENPDAPARSKVAGSSGVTERVLLMIVFVPASYVFSQQLIAIGVL